MRDADFPALLQSFFTTRLRTQRKVSPHTIASYRDTFRLLLQFAQKRLRKAPSELGLADLDASCLGAFLHDLENRRNNSARSRNLRLTAVRSFFRYAALEAPAHAAIIRRYPPSSRNVPAPTQRSKNPT
jgi:site-specific recombinase XerC